MSRRVWSAVPYTLALGALSMAYLGDASSDQPLGRYHARRAGPGSWLRADPRALSP
jgi:hypothetical protein